MLTPHRNANQIAKIRASRSRIKSKPLVGALFLFTAACGLEGQEEGLSENTTQALYGKPDSGRTYWNTSEGQAAYIPVCWSTLAAQGKYSNGTVISAVNPLADIQRWVREGVENSWMRVANIEFYGWGTCTNNNAPGTVVLWFDPSDQSQVGKSSTSATNNYINPAKPNRDSFVEYAIHEFGHVLGFAHEMVRPDNWANGSPQTCVSLSGSDPVGPVTGGTTYTAYVDKNSTMCYDTRRTTLSPGDVFGVQRRYGRKYVGSVVGFKGQCLDLPNGNTATGTGLIAYPCRGQTNDTWFRVTDREYFRATLAGSTQRCANVSGGTVNPNGSTPVISWGCGTDNNEKFPLTNLEWRAMGNMCVQADSDHRLRVYTCNGSTAQKWTFHEGDSSTTLRFDQIKSVSTGECVSKQTSGGALGEVLTLTTCSSTDTKQRFTHSTSAPGVLSAGTYCMNVLGGLPNEGSQLGLWDGCGANPFQNSQFYVSGQLKSLGQCLDILGGAGNPGDAVGVYPCVAGAANQTWDYYF